MDWQKLKLNWKTGFYRLWLVASGLWCAFIAYDVLLDWNNYYSSLYGRTSTALIKFAVYGPLPCVAVAGIGVLIGWALKGFVVRS